MVEKALWFIEHYYGEEITLDDMAGHIGVSRYHLSRGFPLAVGMSISAYLRGRRLTEAAKALAAGAPDILSVALDACYGSHEAFTRAFREQFGMTPEQVRARGSMAGLALVEPIRFDTSLFVDLPPPRTVEGRSLTIAGLAERHGIGKPEEVPAQWQRFNRYLGSIPFMTGLAAYGVVMDLFFGGETFQYCNGVEVTAVRDLPPELTALRLPAQRYAAFTHPGHVARMRTTVHTIFNRSIEEHGLDIGDYPNFVEYYGPGFDPEAGEGDVEIWVPLRA
ncbi:MAG TPA: AraC family transcriptional regulator [Alphaproteobacteria bacterium]|nr:AraC family transcriptional regulator [Alphaproteobacteria bacterium]